MRLDRRGQSMVEMAILSPLLIFMLIGLFEVGYYIRHWITLENYTREIARYATRSDVLDFYGATVEQIGYDRVIEHAEGIGHQLPSDVGIVISLYDIPGQYSCDPAEREEPEEGSTDLWPNCNCTLAILNPYTVSLSRSPELEPWLRYRTDPELVSAIDDLVMVQKLTLQNRKFNCELGKQNPYIGTSDNRVVAVEVFANHNQLFGFPFIANPYTDPLPIRAQAIMRQTRNRE